MLAKQVRSAPRPYRTQSDSISFHSSSSLTFMMVSIIIIITAIATTNVAVANALKERCRSPYEKCGWILANSDFGMQSPEICPS